MSAFYDNKVVGDGGAIRCESNQSAREPERVGAESQVSEVRSAVGSRVQRLANGEARLCKYRDEELGAGCGGQ